MIAARHSLQRLLWPMLIAAGAASSAPAGAEDEAFPVRRHPWVDQRPQPRGAALLRSEMVRIHNRTRADAGTPALAWSDALARDAAGYAAVMARTGRFAHSALPRGDPVQGENIWMGTRTAYAYREMADSWVREKPLFKRGRFPDVSRNGNVRDVGHYTQIIWRTTTAFGCGFAASRTHEYLVCRYSPSGNVIGFDPLVGTPPRE